MLALRRRHVARPPGGGLGHDLHLRGRHHDLRSFERARVVGADRADLARLLELRHLRARVALRHLQHLLAEALLRQCVRVALPGALGLAGLGDARGSERGFLVDDVAQVHVRARIAEVGAQELERLREERLAVDVRVREVVELLEEDAVQRREPAPVLVPPLAGLHARQLLDVQESAVEAELAEPVVEVRVAVVEVADPVRVVVGVAQVRLVDRHAVVPALEQEQQRARRGRAEHRGRQEAEADGRLEDRRVELLRLDEAGLRGVVHEVHHDVLLPRGQELDGRARVHQDVAPAAVEQRGEEGQRRLDDAVRELPQPETGDVVVRAELSIPGHRRTEEDAVELDLVRERR